MTQVGAPLSLFLGELIMIKEVPFVARMIFIEDIISENKENQSDISYANPKYDSDCEYCLNTTAWD